LADEIKPTQPSSPSPLLSPSPEDDRRKQRRPQQQGAEDKKDKPKPKDDGKGGQIDEYV